MSRTQQTVRSLRRQRGQSMTEYAIICAVLVTALLVPLPPSQQTIGQMLAGSVRAFYADLTMFVSLP
jgi:hypothetical protein